MAAGGTGIRKMPGGFAAGHFVYLPMGMARIQLLFGAENPVPGISQPRDDVALFI